LMSTCPCCRACRCCTLTNALPGAAAGFSLRYFDGKWHAIQQYAFAGPLLFCFLYRFVLLFTPALDCILTTFVVHFSTDAVANRFVFTIALVDIGVKVATSYLAGAGVDVLVDAYAPRMQVKSVSGHKVAVILARVRAYGHGASVANRCRIICAALRCNESRHLFDPFCASALDGCFKQRLVKLQRPVLDLSSAVSQHSKFSSQCCAADRRVTRAYCLILQHTFHHTLLHVEGASSL